MIRLLPLMLLLSGCDQNYCHDNSGTVHAVPDWLDTSAGFALGLVLCQFAAVVIQRRRK